MDNMFSATAIYYIETFIRYFIYIIIMFGTWLAVYQLLQPIRTKKKFNFKSTNKEKSPLFKHIEMVVSVTYNTKSHFVVSTFYVISITLAALTFMLLNSLGKSILNAVIFSLLASMLPYILLRTRLRSIRIESSYEAEGVVTEIINQYKINHNNMSEAIDRAIPRLKKQPWTKKALFRIASELARYQTKEELQDIILEFTFSIDTQWAIVLGNNIFLAIEYGDDVNESLEDILDELKDLNRVNQKNNQINNESYVMIKYVSPISFIFSIFIIFKNFHFTLNKYIDYQFRNTLGLKFFTLTIVAILLNFIVYTLVKKPKNDF